jgi:hypothetical protein
MQDLVVVAARSTRARWWDLHDVLDLDLCSIMGLNMQDAAWMHQMAG